MTSLDILFWLLWVGFGVVGACLIGLSASIRRAKREARRLRQRELAQATYRTRQRGTQAVRVLPDVRLRSLNGNGANTLVSTAPDSYDDDEQQ